MKLLKWLLWLVLFAVVVAVGGAIFVVTTVNPNDFKPQISQKVEDLTGRKLELNGDISWRFYPWVGVTLNEFSLSNREGFEPANMLQAEYVDVQLKLLPLLSKQIEVGKVKLQAPIIKLSVNAAGETNWDDLTGADKAEVQDSTTPGQEAGAMVGGLVIQGVDISKGEIGWRDDVVGQQFDLSEFELMTDEIQTGEPIGFDLKTKLAGTDIPDAADISLNGALRINAAFDDIKLDYLNAEAAMQDMDAKVEVDSLGFMVSSGELLAKEIKADLKMPDMLANAVVNEVSFSTESSEALVKKLVGSVSMDQLSADIDADTIRYAVESGQLALKAINYSGKHELGEFKGESEGLEFSVNENALSLVKNSISGAYQGLPVKLDTGALQLDLNKETLVIPELAVSAGDAILNAKVKATQLMGDLQASGKLSSNSFKPREIVDALQLDVLSDLPDSVIQNASIETDFEGGLNGVALDNLKLKLDQSSLAGKGSVQNFEQPVIRFDLSLDKINLDDYMTEDTQAVAEEAGGPAAVAALPFAVLKGLDAKGQFALGELSVTGMDIANVLLKVDSAANRIEVSPLSANLYGGEIVNTLVYDISGDKPAVDIKSTLNKLDIGPFLKAMQITDRLEGKGQADVALKSAGLTPDEMIAGLNGVIKLEMNDGAITGVNLQKTVQDIASAYQSIKGKELGLKAEVGDKTAFSNFKSTVNVQNGVLMTNDINLMAPGMRVKGGGTVDLNTEQLDLTLNLSLVASAEGQGGDALENLRGETIPIKIKGSLDAPNIYPDLSDILQRQIERELSKKYLGGKKLSGESFDKALGDKLSERLNKKLGIEPAPVEESPVLNNAGSTGKDAIPQDAPEPDIQAVPDSAPAEKAESPKKQLEKELKNQLMKSIFGG